MLVKCYISVLNVLVLEFYHVQKLQTIRISSSIVVQIGRFNKSFNSSTRPYLSDDGSGVCNHGDDLIGNMSTEQLRRTVNNLDHQITQEFWHIGIRRHWRHWKISWCHKQPLHATPLHATPLHVTPLHATPLHDTPLHATPLHATPLHATPLQVTPLDVTPLIAKRHNSTQPLFFR